MNEKKYKKNIYRSHRFTRRRRDAGRRFMVMRGTDTLGHIAANVEEFKNSEYAETWNC